MVNPPREALPWQALGRRLVAARLARQWTVAQFAEAAGAAAQTVKAWERGGRRPSRRPYATWRLSSSSPTTSWPPWRSTTRTMTDDYPGRV
jgi:DNA-binding XRE family transcriptional regulator